MKTINVVSIIAVILVLISCTGRSSNTDSTNKWQKEVEGYLIELQEVPSERIVHNEIQRGVISQKDKDSRIAELKQHRVFIFEIDLKDPQDIEKINEMKLSNALNNEILSKSFYMTVGDEKIKPVFTYFQGGSSMKNKIQIFIDFEINDSQISKMIYDDPFFNLGIIKFNLIKQPI